MEKLHTIQEAAETLCVSESWIRQRIAKKQIRFVSLGGRKMLLDSTIKEIVQNGTVEPVEKQ